MTEQDTAATPDNNSNDGEAQVTEPTGQLGAGADVPEAIPTLDSESKGESQTDDAKTDGTEEGATDPAKDAADQQPEGAPETYEDFTSPEGADLDPGAITAFGEAAKAANLTQESAQAMFDSLSTGLTQAGTDRIGALAEQWGNEIRTDAEIGGAKMNEHLATARKAYDAFASDELRTLLKATGLESNPEIVRVFFRAGRALSDDSFVADGARGGGGAKPDFTSGDDIHTRADVVAATLFPTSAKKRN